MDEDYFVTARQPVPPEAPARLTPEQVAELDLSGLHEPFRTPGSLRVAVLLGRLLMAAGVLLLAALPVVLVLGLFDFLESLPW